MKKEITIDELLGWGTCSSYTREVCLEISAGKESMTPLEIAALPILAEDRLWVLLRPSIIPERELHLLACKWGEEVLPFFERTYPNNDRPRKAIEAKRLWIEGKISDEDLSIARAAAWESAWGSQAAKAAAWGSAREAKAAAWGSAWESAKAAAWAARAAAWESARESQVADVIEVLKKGEE